MNISSIYIFHVVVPCLVLDQMGITLDISISMIFLLC